MSNHLQAIVRFSIPLDLTLLLCSIHSLPQVSPTFLSGKSYPDVREAKHLVRESIFLCPGLASICPGRAPCCPGAHDLCPGKGAAFPGSYKLSN
ncbi:hypothetical protein [Marinifilum flexuosum]|uniref:hypothetical protein n=1 Tax=Marinifilum flexuosum TaxID=1117708 RepID=UPI0024941A35|nr:hypothetical protein [Marinifilum flexuosum]